MNPRLLILPLIVFMVSACQSSREKSSVLVKSAVIKLYNHDSEGALRELEEAIRLDPENAEAYFYRGNIRYGSMQYDLALEDYTKSVTLNESFADAWSNRGDLYQAIGQMDKACPDWRKAEELGKQNMQDKLRFCGPAIR